MSTAKAIKDRRRGACCSPMGTRLGAISFTRKSIIGGKAGLVRFGARSLRGSGQGTRLGLGSAGCSAGSAEGGSSGTRGGRGSTGGGIRRLRGGVGSGGTCISSLGSRVSTTATTTRHRTTTRTSTRTTTRTRTRRRRTRTGTRTRTGGRRRVRDGCRTTLCACGARALPRCRRRLSSLGTRCGRTRDSCGRTSAACRVTFTA